jgi:hypothetical protein
MKPQNRPPATGSVTFTVGIALLVLGFPLKAAAQKPPAGAGIPIPTISIGTDGIKINLPRPPTGPGISPGGPRPTATAPAPPRPSDDAELEAFRRALAAQATSAQVSAYLSLVKSTRTVISKFEDLRAIVDQPSVSAEWTSKKVEFDESLQKARILNKAFIESFSESQKGALTVVTTKLIRADSRLVDQAKALDASVSDLTTNKGEFASATHRFEKTFTDFREQQRLLGEQMYALPDPGEEQLLFTMPASTNSVTLGDQTIVVRTSSTISRPSTASFDGVVHLRMTANLGDLQQSISSVLQSQLARSDPCGEQVTIQQAMIGTSSPTTDVWVQLHFERWACLGPLPSRTPVEVIEANGSMTVKVTPAVDKDGSLSILTHLEAVEATGMLADMLRSGPLGDAVCAKIKRSFVTALQDSLNLSAVLQPMRPDSATIEAAKFVRDSNGGTLALTLDGHLRLSGEQVAVLNGEKSESPPAHETTQR